MTPVGLVIDSACGSAEHPEAEKVFGEVPRALWLPPELEELQERGRKPRGACQVPIRGDFLFHCHLEVHMMMGLAGLVRSRERVWVTEQVLASLEIELPYDDGNCCPGVDGTLPCATTQQNPEMPGMPGMGGGGMAGMPMPGMGPGTASVDDALAEAAAKGAWEMLPCDSVTLAEPRGCPGAGIDLSGAKPTQPIPP